MFRKLHGRRVGPPVIVTSPSGTVEPNANAITRAPTNSRTCADSYSNAITRTCTYVNTDPSTHAFTCTNANSITHAHTCTNSDTRTHTCTNSDTRTNPTNCVD